MTNYEMQRNLEEIRESFKVLDGEIQMYQGESHHDDIKACNGDVFMAHKNPSLYTQFYDNLFNLLQSCLIVVESQLEVVNKRVEAQEEEERKLEAEEAEREAQYRLGVYDDPRLWKVV